MGKNFDTSAFIEYALQNYANDGFIWIRELLENILNYAEQHKNTSRDQLVTFLYDLFPGMELGEIAQFEADASLTADTQAEKANWAAA